MARTLRAVATDIEERMAGEEGGSISRCGGVVPALLRLAYRSAASGYDAAARGKVPSYAPLARLSPGELDRKSTRLNSSHLVISYAVFCLKKKKKRLKIVPHKHPKRLVRPSHSL